MRATKVANPFANFVTLRDVMRETGDSYFTAYGLGASGQLGDPIVVGRTQLFPKSIAQGAIARRLAERSARFTGRTKSGVRCVPQKPF
jgi:hypothetical protein